MSIASILVAEDELIVAKDIEYRLRNLGYQVCGMARTGEEAVQRAGETRPDLVLMDIRLEGAMDGISAAEQLRARWDIPVVFITAYADDRTVERAKHCEPLGYILKPFDATILRVTIEVALHKHYVEQKLKESETRYRDLVNCCTDCVWRIDSEGRFTFLSPVVAHYLGYEAGELIGQSFETIVAEESIPSVRRCLEKHANGELRNINVFLELKHRRRDGTEMVGEIHAAPIVDAEGRVTEIQGVTRDIAERLRMQQALRESEERFRQMAEHIDAVFWLKKGDYSAAMYVSPAYEKIWGRPVESIYEQPDAWIDAVHPDDKAQVQRNLRETAAGRFSTMEYRILRPDGALRWIHARTFPILDAAGHLYRIAGVAMDITEAKLAEEERRRLEKQLLQAQKVESLATLAGGIAHDFNNLLMGILGNVDLARMSLSEEAPERANLREIERAGRRAIELSAQMMAYSGGNPRTMELVELSSLIRGMAHLLQNAPSPNPIHYEFAETPLIVKGDSAQLRQLIINLVSNAAEALEGQEGVISIRTALVAATCDDLAKAYVDDQLPPGDYLCLEVSDTGCGMNEETRLRIFDPFFTTKFMGRGLGLPAVLGIVRGHRGAIRVETAPNRGTTVRVLLPKAADSVAGIADTGETEPPWRGQGAIVLLADEEFVRALSARMLERLGFDVLAAAEIEEGLAWLEQEREDIAAVLLDLSLSPMNPGLVVKKLQAVRPGIPVVLSSGYAETEIFARFHDLGLAGFLQKPYSEAELANVFRAVLEKQA